MIERGGLKYGFCQIQRLDNDIAILFPPRISSTLTNSFRPGPGGGYRSLNKSSKIQRKNRPILGFLQEVTDKGLGPRSKGLTEAKSQQTIVSAHAIHN